MISLLFCHGAKLAHKSTSLLSKKRQTLAPELRSKNPALKVARFLPEVEQSGQKWAPIAGDRAEWAGQLSPLPAPLGPSGRVGVSSAGRSGGPERRAINLGIDFGLEWLPFGRQGRWWAATRAGGDQSW